MSPSDTRSAKSSLRRCGHQPRRAIINDENSFSHLVSFLDGALRDEFGHRVEFARLMSERGIIPCAMLKLWGIAGLFLGVATGLLGRSAILACTVAVERTVHRHLVDQLAWLVSREGCGLVRHRRDPARRNVPPERRPGNGLQGDARRQGA